MAPSTQTHPHLLRLPTYCPILKYIQLALAVLTLALSAFNVAMIPYSAHAYAIFVTLYTIGTTIYYLVASCFTPESYSWVALLVLEILSVIFWLACWAVLTALFVVLSSETYYYGGYDYYYSKRAVERRGYYELGEAYTGCLITAMALGIVQFLLYVFTLVIILLAVHRHRKAGGPMRAGSPSGITANAVEKGSAMPMQPVHGITTTANTSKSKAR